MARRPRVTIGLPVRDGERYLAEAVEAILGQTWTDLELLISDNASSDATPAICADYARRDSRIRYRRHPRNLGAGPNYNRLVEWASGDLFRWATHDDLIEPTLVERCVEALDASPPEVALAFSETQRIDGRGDPLPDELTPAPWRGGPPAARLGELLLGRDSYIVNCAPVFGVIRTPVLRSTRLVRGFESADKVLLVELALRGEIARIPEPLSLRRIHAETHREAHASAAERAQWFDARARVRHPMPRTRLALGYADALRRAPLGVRDRAACAAVLGRWLAAHRRWRVVAGECRTALGDRLAAARAPLRRA